jgi:hypothetical protein
MDGSAGKNARFSATVSSSSLLIGYMLNQKTRKTLSDGSSNMQTRGAYALLPDVHGFGAACDSTYET